MKLISIAEEQIVCNGKFVSGSERKVRALMMSNTTPSIFPTTGASISGLGSDVTFAPMSVIFVLDEDAEHKIYVTNESGSWVAVDGSIAIAI